MKCPYCGADSKSSTCKNCGRKIPPKKRKCPKCGGSNTQSRKELRRSTRPGTETAESAYRTVWTCRDCGFSWVPKKKKFYASWPWWFWALVIIFFPVSLSIWFWNSRKVRLDRQKKIIVLVVFWLILLLLLILKVRGSSSSDSSTAADDIVVTTETENDGEDEETTGAAALENVASQGTDTSDTAAETDTGSYTGSVETQEVTTVSEKTAYTTTDVNVRQEPNTTSTVLTSAPAGVSVTVLSDSENGWTNIRYNSTEGYIYSDYLTEPVASESASTAAASSPNSIVVNSANGKVHQADCDKLPEESNRIYYDSLSAAEAAGYTDLCEFCN